MHPILFVLEVGGTTRPIASFGVLLALGMVLGAAVSVRACARAGIDPGDALAATAIVAASGLAGAYALQVVVETLRGVAVSDAIARGGLTFYGAPIVGLGALALASRPLGIPFLRLCDAAIPGVPIAHAMGRLGCFFAGCCYGHPTDLSIGVSFTHEMAAASIDPVARHPVQLYESGALLLLALAFLLVPAGRIGDGRRAIAYAGAYAFVRIATERFRGDVERGFVFGPVSTSDAISFGVILLVAAYFAFARRSDAAGAAGPSSPP